MDLKEVYARYWHEAVEAERKLCIPAIYLLAHAIQSTSGTNEAHIGLRHGFDVVIPVRPTLIKRIAKAIKKFFVKEVLNIPENICVDGSIIIFLESSIYHPKFKYLQSEKKFCEYLYRGLENEKALTDELMSIIDALNKVKRS